MSSIRLRQISVSILVAISLFVSAVSACACNHHQPNVVTVANSCHGSSHESNEQASSAVNLSDSVDESCTCFEKTPASVVLGKSENKKKKSPHSVADFAPFLANFADATISSTNDPLIEVSGRSYNSTAFLVSGPARAPPRL
jgi:hypothetical protein